MEKSQEFLKRDFIHHLSDTLALLGAGEDLVNKVRQVEEKPLTSQIIDEIRKFNVAQIDKTKSRLALLNVTTISVSH